MKNITTLLIAFLLCMLFTAATASAQRWTYPGNIYSHLQTGHGLTMHDLAGKSQAEAERLHDSLHNANRSSGVIQKSYRLRAGFTRPAPRVLTSGPFSFRRR